MIWDVMADPIWQCYYNGIYTSPNCCGRSTWDCVDASAFSCRCGSLCRCGGLRYFLSMWKTMELRSAALLSIDVEDYAAAEDCVAFYRCGRLYRCRGLSEPTHPNLSYTIRLFCPIPYFTLFPVVRPFADWVTSSSLSQHLTLVNSPPPSTFYSQFMS